MKTISEQIIYLNHSDLENFSPEYGCIYSGLPNELYHEQEDSESSTTIKILLISIKHWLDRENKHTDAMAFGTLFHDSMEALRTGKDLTEFSRVIDSYGRSKKEDAAKFILKYYPLVYGEEYEKDLKEMCAKNVTRDSLHELADQLEEIYLDGREKVTTENFERSSAMVEAIKGHPVSSKLIDLHGHSELSFFYTVKVELDDGEIIPVNIRVRPDDLIEFEDEIWVDDWKSIGDVATDKNIKKACWNHRYDIQAAMYQDVVSKFTQKPVYFRLVFAEKEKPAKEKVRVVQLPDWDMEAGWNDYREALINKAMWLRDNTIWTGYDIPENGIDVISMRKPDY
jgi:hypothetical protein